ncbi:winged helix-turn-helix transcriptional regulator [Alistipes sp.]|uniref:winged helix-turn-helix transcriptional regulator n=1 Tax=Alistipes sp. TaxID=1872444 RepID=UPI003AF0BF9F
MHDFSPTGRCPIREVLSRLGDKWSLLVLLTLHANGVMRFSAIQRSLSDISQRMLTVTLRTLEADGLVARQLHAEVPPRVEYRLTERGESLLPHIDALVEWAGDNLEAILSDRTKSRALSR